MSVKNPYKVETILLDRFRGVATPELMATLSEPYVGNSLNAVSPKLGLLRHRDGMENQGTAFQGSGLLTGISFQDNALIIGVGTGVWTEPESVLTMLPFGTG